MEWLTLDPAHPTEAAPQAVSVLKKGGIIIFPAERLYGLGADAANPKAVARIFALKGRGRVMPLPVVVEDEPAARQWVEINKLAERLIRAFWPGPLTLVLPARQSLPGLAVNPGGALGIGVPGNPFARAIAQMLGSPVTATSANQSGEPSGRTALEAVAGLEGEVDLVLDVGELPGPPGSTVIKVHETGWEILRPGIISIDRLQSLTMKAEDK